MVVVDTPEHRVRYVIPRCALALAACLRAAAGSTTAVAAIAHPEPGTTYAVTRAAGGVHDGGEYSVGSKVYHPDGSYRICTSSGQGQRIEPGTGNEWPVPGTIRAVA